MGRFRHIIFVLLAMFFAGESMAQIIKAPRKSNKDISRPYKFKNNRKMKVICPIFHPSEYPYQGIGAKIGDPFALTYKLYLTERFAISIDGGQSAKRLYSKFHRERFQEYPIFDFDTLRYNNHVVERDWVISGRMLVHNPMDGILPGLDWYIGAGWQIRYLTIEYEYLLDLSPTRTDVGFDAVEETNAGPEVILGIEYAYFEIPVSAFFELNAFQSINGGWRRIQGGVGLRFVF